MTTAGVLLLCALGMALCLMHLLPRRGRRIHSPPVAASTGQQSSVVPSGFHYRRLGNPLVVLTIDEPAHDLTPADLDRIYGRIDARRPKPLGAWVPGATDTEIVDRLLDQTRAHRGSRA